MVDFDAAEIRPDMRSDPLIAFFARVNPDYKLGKGIPVIFRMSPWKVLYVFFIVLSFCPFFPSLELILFFFQEHVLSANKIKSSSYQKRNDQT